VTGKVTYKGSPVTGGTVHIVTEGGNFPANIKRDGTFTAADIPAGPAKVTVETESIHQNARQDPAAKAYMEKNPNMPLYMPIPKRYAKPETSGLTLDVRKGMQEKTFDLTE